MRRTSPTSAGARSPADSALERGYLRCASPDRVYDYLRERSAEDWREVWSKDPPIPDETLQVLHARREPLIDLAIARFGGNRELARALWESGDPDVRCALLSNFWARAPSLAGRGGLVDWEMTAHTLFHGTLDEAAALLANPSTAPELLQSIFGKEGFGLESLDEVRWRHLLYPAARNPALTIDDWEDGWEWYQYQKVLDAACRLLTKVPVERSWTFDLQRIFWTLPIKFPIRVPTNGLAPAIKEQEEEFIRQVLERWRTEEPSDYLSDHFGHLRRLIAFKATQRMRSEFLRNSEDPFVREGFYAAVRHIDADELNGFCSKDGVIALRGLVDNVWVCGRQDLREVLAELCKTVPVERDIDRELLEMDLKRSQKLADAREAAGADEECRLAQVTDVERSTELVRADVRDWRHNLNSELATVMKALGWGFCLVILMVGLILLRVW